MSKFCFGNLVYGLREPPGVAVIRLPGCPKSQRKAGKMQFLGVSVIFVLYLSCVSGLYFHIAETERKCFIEEIPDETMVIGKWFQRNVFVDSLGPKQGHVIIVISDIWPRYLHSGYFYTL